MAKKTSLEDFINNIPKAELHIHIEGTFEPELMFKIAKRNNIDLKYKSLKELKDAYNFTNLQDFLDIYYRGTGLLLNEQDFYDLTFAYLEKASSQHVVHTEIFFDPQAHTARNVEFSTVIKGIHRALLDAKKKSGISSRLIMCFLRHLDESSARKTLKEALVYKNWITATGLDSSEAGNPPSKFKTVFANAREQGFLTVAHAGEEGPSEYIWEALDILKVSRIDHGNNSINDNRLIAELVRRKIPLTICPLSNLKLKVIDRLDAHPLREMMRLGLTVTINSDDPAYFGGYINENYLAIARALDLTKEEIYAIAKNSFKASFLKESEKDDFIRKLDEYAEKNI